MAALMVLIGANPYQREVIVRYFNNLWWYGIAFEEIQDQSLRKKCKFGLEPPKGPSYIKVCY